MLVGATGVAGGTTNKGFHLSLAEIAAASLMSVRGDDVSCDADDAVWFERGRPRGPLGPSARPSITALRRGDEAAWRWFVDEYGQGVLNYARRMGHRDPDEVMGATLETVARGILRFEGNHGQLRSFVFSVAHARIVDDARKRSRRQDLGVGHLAAMAVDDEVDTGTDEHLLEALGQLSESQRMMIYLRHVEGLSTKETARAVGKSEVATRVALSRGLSQLRDILGGVPR